MKLSELLGADAYDESGRRLGRVHDVRVVQDGPMVDGATATFRLASLIVSPHSLGSRLGLDRRSTRAPWLVAALARWLQRDTRIVDWGDVVEVGDDRVVVRADAAS
jgi:sporulation protein YlmC with PRC-barrel domain